MFKFLKYISVCLIICGCACTGNAGKENTLNKGGAEPNPKPVLTTDAYAYITTADKQKLFVRENLKFGKTATMSPYAIRLTDERFQTVDGFGAAITVSSCYLLSKMANSERESFLKKVFDTSEGIGSSLVRVCIGGSDFSWDYGDSGLSEDGRYSWCDKEGISNFTPHPMDVKYLIPILKEIIKINPNVKIVGSPWTAPRWMKLSSTLKFKHYSWTGGRLNPKYYKDYATYFVKWIQYMQSQGINIYAITPQNEPLNAGNSMSMLMPWEDCRDFIKLGLGPAFTKSGINTKILIFDHNYNYDNKKGQDNYPLKIYEDKEASKYIAGSAWHNYGGNVSELNNVSSKAPDKEIYFTEASIGTWNYDFSSCLLNDFHDIILGTLSRDCKGVIFWNLLLDDKHGPYTKANGSCTTCYGAATVLSSDSKTIDYYSQYYNIAHCSKVIKPGAIRIGTKGFTSNSISYQVYKNTDSSYGVIILNETNSEQKLVFIDSKHSVRCNVPGKSIVSLSWKD